MLKDIPAPAGGRSRSVYAVSLGCPRNLVDTERFLALAAEQGFRLAEKPEEAGLFFLNTCAFLGEAVEESTGFLEELAACRERFPGSRLVVAGCLVSRFGKKLEESYPAIDRLVYPPELNPLPRRSPCTPSHYAYLKVAEGCRNHCSYCLIPSLRGGLRSLPAARILDEARALAAAGAREINIIAQDTTAWGKDLENGETGLAGLIERLCSVEGPGWLRLLYTYPDAYDEKLIETLENFLLDPFAPSHGTPRVCPYLDIPLQHASDRILRAMNRRGTADGYRDLVRKLRGRLPELALRTTFIVGFPGETADDFALLEDFVQEIGFHKMGVFRYSREPGTRAHDYPGQVPEKLKDERFQRLMEIQAGISRRLSAEMVGRELEVLVEGEAPGCPGRSYGRTCFDAPEVDGIFRLDRPLPVGTLARARVTGFSDYDLEGEVTDP